MKKVLTLLITVFSILFISFNSVSAASLEKPEKPEKPNIDFKVGFDLQSNEVQEEVITDENGNYVGTIGIEPVPTMSTLSSSVGYGNSTFKIYWYTAAVNLSYYINVYRSSVSPGYSKITAAYDEWFLLSPPLSYNWDKLSIERAQADASHYAKARYRLNYGVLGAGAINYDLIAEVLTNTLYTGVSSF